MKQFRKHAGKLLLRLLLSEILCLILAFSFALLGGAMILRIISTLCGITAHILLTADAARKAADDDLKLYRQTGFRQGSAKPLLLALTAMLPAYLFYLLLCINQNSVPAQNFFLLLNAPFIGINRFLFGAHEPFSAVPPVCKILTAIPPLMTGFSVTAGYLPHYLRGLANAAAGSFRA